MTRVILQGSSGRMGKVVIELSQSTQDFEIVAGVDTFPNEQAFPVYTSIKEVKEEADVVIDFSNAEAVDDLLDYCVDKKLPVVLCTTGLSDDQLDRVVIESKNIAILRSANMSIGVNLLLSLVKEAAHVLKGKGFDIEIVEKHHRNKLDAPSGTAIALAEAAEDGIEESMNFVYDRSRERKKRGDNEIGFSSVRGGSITGDHDVIFAGIDETLTLSHVAYSREVFAKGGIAAAQYLAGKEPGLYSMQDVIKYN